LRGQPVLVLGAGEAADSLLRELHRSGLWYAVAVVSKDPANKGRRLRGLPVFGPLQIIPDLAQKYSVQHVIMAMPASTTLERRQAAEIAAAAGLTVMTMPSYDDLLAGRVSVSSIRRVELEDLLGREAVALDQVGLHELLTDRVVLVSGAGGRLAQSCAGKSRVFLQLASSCWKHPNLPCIRLTKIWRTAFRR
jgi:FlaA1/EpsC-like NDP-sugar epimerase